MQFPHVRKFILSHLLFNTAELMLFGAMQTPEDDLFYLSEDSPEWRLVNEHLEVHEI